MKKALSIIILAISIIFSLAGCAAAPSGEEQPPETTSKKAENQDKYIGKYNLVSIDGDKSIKNNYKYYYIELEKEGYLYQIAEPVKEKGVRISNYGKYVIMEDGSLEFTYAGMEEYIQKAEVKEDNILYIDTVDGYRYVYKLAN